MLNNLVLLPVMIAAKADIITQLKKDILSFQGFRSALNNSDLNAKLGRIKNAFPGSSFPLGAMHEFISNNAEDAAVTAGFVAGILGSLMQKSGAAIWIGSSKTIFLPALKSFGIAPDKIIFIDLQKEKQILWAMEEALKCEGLAGVVAQLKELDFATSRRLQLAVEKSQVTGFILRHNPKSINTTACISRWKISSLPSEVIDGMPGVGFPRWNVELLRVRNGKPANWQIELIKGRFRHIYKTPAIPQIQKAQTG